MHNRLAHRRLPKRPRRPRSTFVRPCRRRHGSAADSARFSPPRAQALPDREAVVDGDARLTYAQFGRADRSLVRGAADARRRARRSRGIHRAEHARQPRGVLRRAADRRDDRPLQLPADGRRFRLPDRAQRLEGRVRASRPDGRGRSDSRSAAGATQFVALEGARGRLARTTSRCLATPRRATSRPAIDERDLLSINYTSGTTSRPKGVMITHRNAYMNAVGTLIHLPMRAGERYLWTLPMFHANGWTFTWIVTAVGGTHVCLRKVDPAQGLRADSRRAHHHALRGADRADRARQRRSAPCARGAPRGVRVVTAGAPPAAATIRTVEEELGWTVTHVYGLTETSPFITVCEPRPSTLARHRQNGAESRRARASS